jgi:Tol biopolymer transport system component
MIFTYFFSSRQGVGTDILAICPDGSDPRQVTTGGLNTNAPRWSPDRTQIAYLSDRSGSNQLHIMDKDGGNDRQLTSASDLEAWNVLWLPDGNRIAIWGVFNDDWQWQAVNVLTGEITPLAEWAFEGGEVSLSHDGTRLAYIAHTNPEDYDSPIEILVQDIDGSNSYQLTSTGWEIHNPVWSPDDSQIAFLSSSAISPDQNSPDSIQNAIYIINLDGSNLHDPFVTGLNPDRIAWSPDGESLAVIAREIQSTGDLFNPEITVYTLNTLNIRTGEKTALYKAIAPNRITHLSW